MDVLNPCILTLAETQRSQERQAQEFSDPAVVHDQVLARHSRTTLDCLGKRSCDGLLSAKLSTSNPVSQRAFLTFSVIAPKLIA